MSEKKRTIKRVNMEKRMEQELKLKQNETERNIFLLLSIIKIILLQAHIFF